MGIYIINNLFKQAIVINNMNKINKLFSELKKNDLLEDRSEYDIEDLQSTYKLNKKDAKLLFLKIKKWKGNLVKRKHIVVR